MQVIAHNELGLVFKNKRDRKVINVDPEVWPTERGRVVACGDTYICVCGLLTERIWRVVAACSGDAFVLIFLFVLLRWLRFS